MIGQLAPILTSDWLLPGVSGAGDLPERGRGPPGRDQDGAVRAPGVLGRPPESEHAARAGDHRGEPAAAVREVAAQGQVSKKKIPYVVN